MAAKVLVQVQRQLLLRFKILAQMILLCRVDY